MDYPALVNGSSEDDGRSDQIITRSVFGEDLVEQALDCKRHHDGDDGEPYWIAWEIEEIAGTLDYEDRQDDGGRP